MQNTTGGAAELCVLTALFSVNLAALGMLSGWHLAGQSRRAAKEMRLMNLTVIFVVSIVYIAIHVCDLNTLIGENSSIFYFLVTGHWPFLFLLFELLSCSQWLIP